MSSIHTAPRALQRGDGRQPGVRRRGLRVVGWTLVWLGLIAFGTQVWQLYGTGMVASGAQARLEREFADRRTAFSVEGSQAFPSGVDDGAGSDRRRPVAEPAASEGVAIGRIIIPVAGVDHVVVEGVSPTALKDGPGHMPWTPMPGQSGNSVISGHRTTYGAPFYDLDLVRPGDLISVETIAGRYVYEVRRSFVVEPTDVWVTDPLPGTWLTLTTCTPRYSARQRLIIQAELVETEHQAGGAG